MKDKEPIKETEHFVTIQFGTVFKRPDAKYENVVNDFYEGAIHANAIHTSPEGERYITVGSGTDYPPAIEELTGEVILFDDFLRMYKKGWYEQVRGKIDFPQFLEDSLRECFQKEPITYYVKK